MTNVVASQIKFDTIAEGKAIFDEYKKICKADKSRFTKSIGDGGFDNRLGKLLMQLNAEKDGKQISQATLRAHSLDKIDRRRRSEALWFAQNEQECMAFIAESKKGFSSLTALQAAMRKAGNSDEPKAKAKSNATGEAKASNVGQSDEPKAQSAGDIAFEAFCKAEDMGISFADVCMAMAELLKQEQDKSRKVA